MNYSIKLIRCLVFALVLSIVTLTKRD